VAVDGAGNVFVADYGGNTIRKITPAGVVTTLAGTAGMTGSADGTGPDGRFNRPTGVAVDSAGNVYVADNHNSTIRKITPAGVVTTVAGTAGVAGIVLGTTPRLALPRFLAITGDSIAISDNRAILLLRHGAQ
jgi:DNA-binding beta-propeller fold protein YncE